MRHLPRHRALAALSLTLLSVTLAACGDDEPAAAAPKTESAPSSDAPAADDLSNQEPTPATFSEADVIAELGAQDSGGGYAEIPLAGDETCEFIVLASAADVSMYADAGDNVAANPDKTAGAKITDGPEDVCNSMITDLLSDFPPAQ